MDGYLQQRARLLESGTPGLDSARRLSTLTDDAVRELAQNATPLPGRWAVCALGGWGAGALLPASDLDVLVVAEADERALRPFVEGMLYPLWDSGLKVGHQVRSPRAHLTACKQGELETLTASLTARVVAGDASFGTDVLLRVARQAHRSSRKILARLAERERSGTPFLLEPDLKEGAGGRRDFDELIWSAAVLSATPTTMPDAVRDQGLMTPAEHQAVVDAAAVVAAARWELHLFGEGDRMSLDAASSLTVEPEAVQRALITTWVILNRVRRRIAGSPSPNEPVSAADLLAQLTIGSSAFPGLSEQAAGGRLEPLVPGLADLMSLRRPGLAHTLTVGAHSLATAAAISELGRTAGPVAHSAGLVEDIRVLQVAALTHDAGKVQPGPGHAERGAPTAREAARRLDLAPDAAEDAAALVSLHLALVETAMHEDLDNEDTILRVAGRIGRRSLVAPLHVLSVADSLSTGPSACTPWFETLLAQLVARVDTALSAEEDGAGLVTRAAAVREEALRAVPPDSVAQRAFVEAATVRYLASRSAGDVARDARLVSGLSAVGDAEQVRIAVCVGPTEDTRVVTVAAWDRPHLLSRLAGAFALAGLDILGFDAHGAAGAVALDTFVVRSATARPLAPEAFSRLDRLMEAALRDRYELATRLAERRRHYRTRPFDSPTVEVLPSGWDTTVNVIAEDRPGLLHDLAAAVSATGLDIRWARARTIDGVANDTFHVVGDDGGPVDDPGVLGHLTMRLRETL